MVPRGAATEGHPGENPKTESQTLPLRKMEEVLAERLQVEMVEGRHYPNSQEELQGQCHPEEAMTLRMGMTHRMQVAEVHPMEEEAILLLTLMVVAMESHHLTPQVEGVGTQMGTLRTRQGAGVPVLQQVQGNLPMRQLQHHQGAQVEHPAHIMGGLMVCLQKRSSSNPSTT